MRHARLTAGVSRLGLSVLAMLAYVPALLARPGRMPTDTKLYLYLDPGRLITDAPFTWDTRQFGGWVPHQVIAYLWPQGPWYWTFERLGVPDWVAHRLWIATLLFLGGAGVMWAARLLGLSRSGAFVAAAVYQLSPYVLPYLSRTSAMLLPWAALGWIVGLTVRAATSGHRWRHPALLALVLLSCSAVNATAVMMIAPAPVLWLLHSTLQGTIPLRRAVATAARISALAVPVSLWWMQMLRTQGTWGADVLSYSESLQATSLTSTSMETLRGAGYWLFYVRDPYAFTTSASQQYMESGRVMATGFALVLLALIGLTVVRWAHRRFAALLILAGIVLAVGVHPIADASPLMSPLAENSRSALSLAIRSSTRALPVSNLGLALAIGALVTAVGATRFRLRSLAPLLVVLIAVANLPVLLNGGFVDRALERDESPPTAWLEASAHLDNTSSEYRVLQLPGSEFGAFRWGYTVDPPLPGLTTKPLVTRDLLPLGSAGLMDLLYALDDRVQAGVLDPAALAPVARMLGVDTVWVANDLAFDRFRTPRPSAVARQLLGAPDIGAPLDFGDATVNRPDIPMVDESAIASTDDALPPVQLAPVARPLPVVRAADRTVLLVGSGDGVIDAAAAGLLHGDEALVYAADRIDARPSLVILTDSNRDRAHHWRSSQDVSGFTESGGDTRDALLLDEGDQRLPVFGASNEPSDQTVAVLDGGLTVRASGYGEPFAYRPEQRAAMAVDGDPGTAWVVADRNDPVGQFIEVSATDGRLNLLQPQDSVANRRITSVRIDHGGSSSIQVALDGRSLEAPGQEVEVPPGTPLRITITGIGPRPGGTDTGPSAVGFAELGIGSHTEVVRLPTFAEPQGVPIAVVLQRLRTDPLNRWRSDPEPTIEREFTVSHPHALDGFVRLRLDARAGDAEMNALDGTTGPVADRRLTGDPWSRGVFAADDDPGTAWTSPFQRALGSTLTFTSTDDSRDTLVLQQPTDDRHSTITGLRITQADRADTVTVPPPDGDGRSTVTLRTPLRRGDFTLEVTAVASRFTIDRRFAERTELPVAIRELEGVGRSQFALTDHAPYCATDLVSIDGEPLGVSMDETVFTALRAGQSVERPLCDPVDLGAGTHRVSSHRSPGLQVDAVVLRSPDTAAPAATPPTVTLERTRLTRTATVSPCPDGCWMVLGEGHNKGWRASVDGESLGEPVQVAGGMNGWWLPPSDTPTVVRMEWTAQTPVNVALAASALGVLVCIGLALRVHRRTRPVIDARVAPPRLDRTVLAPVPLRAAVASAATAVVLAALIAQPSAALVAAAPAALVLATRRPRIAAVAATLLFSAVAAMAVIRQVTMRFPADAAWPARFEHLHRPGMVVVALLMAGCLFADRRDQAT